MKLSVKTPNETKLLIAAFALMLASGLAIVAGSPPAALQSKPTVLGVTLTSASTTLYSCADTDNGDNPAVKGTVSVTNSSIGLTNLYADSCASSSTVSEYICTAATPTSTAGYVSREETCYNGYCQDGACKKNYSCTDSDGGNYYTQINTKGVITTVSTRTGEIQPAVPDVCYSDVGIKEGVCADNWDAGYYQFSTNCDTGKVCQDGACITPTSTPAVSTSCRDTDGLNTNTRGSVTVTSTAGTARYFDSCVTASVVQELICSTTSSLAAKYLTCAGKKICSDGFCQFPTSTVSFSPSSTIPSDSIAESQSALLTAFTLSVNGTAPATLDSLVLSVEAENASLATPVLFIGGSPKPIYGSATPTKTAKKTVRAYKIVFSNLNAALAKNSATGFRITAAIKKNPRLLPGQLALLQIFLPRDGISWKNAVTRQPSNNVPGLPWTSAKLVIR